MIAAALASACGRSATVRPSLSTNTRSAPSMISSSSEEIISTPQALVGELADQRLNLGLGADVDAARRLVEDQQLRVGAEPARQQHLLLVAAGELADLLLGARRLDGEALHESVDDLALARLVDDADARQARQDARASCSRAPTCRERSRPPCGPRCNSRRRARSPRPARCGETAWPPSRIVPASGGSAPKIARATSVRPEPSRPARPTIWPVAHLDASVAHLAADPKSFGRQHDVARRRHARRRSRSKCARTVSRSRPSIAAIRSSLSMSAIRLAITVRPSRITVTRSQT